MQSALRSRALDPLFCGSRGAGCESRGRSLSHLLGSPVLGCSSHRALSCERLCRFLVHVRVGRAERLREDDRERKEREELRT